MTSSDTPPYCTYDETQLLQEYRIARMFKDPERTQQAMTSIECLAHRDPSFVSRLTESNDHIGRHLHNAQAESEKLRARVDILLAAASDALDTIGLPSHYADHPRYEHIAHAMRELCQVAHRIEDLHDGPFDEDDPDNCPSPWCDLPESVS